MNIKPIKPIDPVVYVIAMLLAIVVFVVYVEITDTETRDKWIAACEEKGGEPFLDVQRRSIGNSVCLKPNSIIKVSVRE